MAKTILEALNELVEKQGGNTEDNKLIVDALNDLVNTSGGSSGATIVDGTVSGTIFTIQKSFAEIHDEFENGGVIYVNFPPYTNEYGNTINENKRCLVTGTSTDGTHGYVYISMSMNDAIKPITLYAATENDNPTYDND